MIQEFLSLSQSKFDELLNAPEMIFSWIEGEPGPDQHMDIDKAWQGIHFLLTGNPWSEEPPLGLVICGGIEFGEDVGYGPARYVLPEEVKAISESLAPLNEETLSKRYDPASMSAQQIYPEIWGQEDDDALGYLLSYFLEVKRLYTEAALAGNAVVHYLT